MIVLITVPTFARDVRPGQVVHHLEQPWEVDEVAHQRDGSVKIAVRPNGRERDGRRTILTHAGEAFVQVLPTREMADQLAPVIADALGTSWCTMALGLTAEHPDAWDEVLTEESGVEWNPATGQVEPVNAPTHTPEQIAKWAGDSMTLNTVAWRLALALGDVQPGDEWATTDEKLEDLTRRVAALLGDRPRVHHAIDLTDITVVDTVLAAVDAAHPTAIADHLRSAERRLEERRALAEMDGPPIVDDTPLHRRMANMTMQQAHERGDREAVEEFTRLAAAREAREVLPELRAVGRDNGDTAALAVLVPAGADHCPISLQPIDDCGGDHVHVRGNAEPLTDAERAELGLDDDETGDHLPDSFTMPRRAVVDRPQA